MSGLKPVRGTYDVLPEEKARHRHVEDTARDVAALYGFAEISTPIFEFDEVFSRTLGETSDIVTKEMYSFDDKGGDRITLRPEGTAGVARAFISNGLAQHVPLKYFYRGPMFRYERPQKGRQRQFHQVGVELLGVDRPQGDIEIIALADQFLTQLGVREKAVLEFNTLGDSVSRQNYQDAIVGYFKKYKSDLSKESQERLDRNPLRIMDSKDLKDIAVIEGAPEILKYLNNSSRKFFDEVWDGLLQLKLEPVHNPYLVRGLDYYCHTAFEFTTNALGAQGALVAGGRYDGLIKQMGGAETPGTGWAAGVERLAMMISEPPQGPRPVVLVPVGAEAEKRGLVIMQQLRRSGLVVEMGYSGNVAKRMKRANKLNAAAVVLLGDDELSRGVATARNMESGEQTEVELSSLEDHLSRYR